MATLAAGAGTSAGADIASRASGAGGPVEASALSELYQALRSILIAVAGVVASAATGVFVQEYLKSRRSLLHL